MLAPLDVTFSYAHEDAKYLEKLKDCLKPLHREGIIRIWSDRDIDPGDKLHEVIKARLESAQLIILLISRDFLASDYCYNTELELALTRHSRQEAYALPIIIRSCAWKGTNVSRLKVLPDDGKPVTSWLDREDDAWLDVYYGVVKVVGSIRTRIAQREKAEERAPEPEVHAPDPREEDVGSVLFFPNPIDETNTSTVPALALPNQPLSQNVVVPLPTYEQQTTSIQRFWYTTPSIKHIDGHVVRGRERFRICAITSELNEDIYAGGAQVYALERYARYTPPEGTVWDDTSLYGEQDKAPLPPDLDGLRSNDSPICLSLIEIQNPEVLGSPVLVEKLRGRVLVNKVYLGEEGSFFIDLLSHLPEDFSAREALALWRSDFWQRLHYSDSPNLRDILPPVELPSALLQELHRRRLGQMPAHVASSALSGEIQDPNDKLPNPFVQLVPSSETVGKLKKILTFLIHAYLLQQHEEWTERTKQAARLAQIDRELSAITESKSKTKELEREEVLEAYRRRRFKRIYLAAEDDQVAYCLTLLASLFRDVPDLLQPLTFSTYEYDVLKSECLIVATSPSRAWEKSRLKLETLLPPECEELGFVYNSYDEARNTPLPPEFAISSQDQPVLVLRVEAVARDLAHNLLKPTKKFATYRNMVANQVTTSVALSPALQVVQLWQKELSILGSGRSQHLTRAEVKRLFTDPSLQGTLVESEVRWKVLQWVVADCKGLDLDQPLLGNAHPPFDSTLDSAGKPPNSQTLLWLERFCQIGDAKLIAALASSTLNCLKAYADNDAQPEASFLSLDYEEHPEFGYSTVSAQPSPDLITWYQKKRDPEPFIALLKVLKLCEPPEKGASSWTALLEYLLSQQEQDGKKTFQHEKAGTFVLGYMHYIELWREGGGDAHQTIHLTLLRSSARVFYQEEHDDLVMPLLKVPLYWYWRLFEGDAVRLVLHQSWRKEALLYQLYQLKPDAKNYLEFLRSHWETHLLLVTEAMDCLSYDDWAYVFPLVEEVSPHFLRRLVRELENPEHVQALQRLIQQHTNTGQSKSKEVLFAFYGKLMKGHNEKSQQKEILFELLAGSVVSQETLDELLSPVWLSSLDKVEFFARFGPTYLPEYFRRPPPQRSKELLRLFTSLIDDNQYTHNQTSRPGESLGLLDRAVLLVILSLWLTAVPLDEADTIKFLIDRAILRSVRGLGGKKSLYREELIRENLAREELASILATFGGQYMASGGPELRKVCQEFFQWLCSRGKLSPELKLQVCLTLLPPDLFPFVPEALSLDDALQILGPAQLAYGERPSRFVDQFLVHILEQRDIAQIRTDQISGFLKRQKRDMDQFRQELQKLLALSAKRTTELASATEAVLREQGHREGGSGSFENDYLKYPSSELESNLVPANYTQKSYYRGDNYQPSELELFLEIQEYRGEVLRESLGPAVSDRRLAVYLYYVDSSGKDRAKPFGELYKDYLQNIQMKNFEQRRRTRALLNTLTGTGALDQSIQKLAEGLLTLGEFLQNATRSHRTRRAARDMGKKLDADSVLSRTALKNLRGALNVLRQEELHEERQVAEALVSAIVPCVTSEFDITLLFNLELGAPLFGPEEKYSGFALLLAMSAYARTYYQEQPRNEWWLPYLLSLPELGRELQGADAVFSYCNKILDALLLVDRRPDEPTVLAIDTYLQRAAAGNLLREVVDIWQNYERSKLLAAGQRTVPLEQAISPWTEGIQAEPSVLVEPDSQIPNEIELPVAGPMAPSEEESLSKERLSSWFERFQVVRAMRNAVKKADRSSIKELWNDPQKRAILRSFRKEIGSVYWERFESIRQLDSAYLELLEGENGPNAQTLNDRFVKSVENCKAFEKKYQLRKSCVTEDQYEKYQRVIP